MSDGQTALPGVDPETLARDAIREAATRDYEWVFAAVSGGTDSLAAVDVFRRLAPEYGLELDGVFHINTGAGLPSTSRTVQEYAAEHGLAYIEGINRTAGEMLAHRVLTHGWPGHGTGAPGKAGGHQMEYINRKERPLEGLYRSFAGDILLVSGARAYESDNRAANMGNSPVDFGETGGRKPRLSWVSPCYGWPDQLKADYIAGRSLPETLAYDFVGYSGECTACSYDHPTILKEIALVSPELAYSLSTLVVWTYQRIRSGRLDVPLHRAVWGWDRALEAGDDDGDVDDDGDEQSQIDDRGFDRMGCASCEKSCYAGSDAAFEFDESAAVVGGAD